MPEEPEGKLLVKNAGMIEIRASFTWQSPEEIPDEVAPEVPAGCKLAVETSHAGAACEVTGKLRAFDEEETGEILESVLRHVVNTASISEAILETRVLKVASTHVPSFPLVCGLARYLWDVGIRVTFGRTWFPLAGGDIALGTGGSNEKLEAILSRDSSWEIANTASG